MKNASDDFEVELAQLLSCSLPSFRNIAERMNFEGGSIRRSNLVRKPFLDESVDSLLIDRSVWKFFSKH